MFDLHCDSLVSWSTFDFFDVLQDLNFPGFFQNFTTTVEHDAVGSIEDDGMCHEDAALRLPVDKWLLLIDELEGSEDGFEDGDFVLVEGHEFLGGWVESGEGGIKVVFMEDAEGREGEEHQFVVVLSDEVVLVVYL